MNGGQFDFSNNEFSIVTLPETTPLALPAFVIFHKDVGGDTIINMPVLLIRHNHEQEDMLSLCTLLSQRGFKQPSQNLCVLYGGFPVPISSNVYISSQSAAQV